MTLDATIHTLKTRTGEWTIIPQSVCRVTGTIYHETCILGNDKAEYPCCNTTILTLKED